MSYVQLKHATLYLTPQQRLKGVLWFIEDIWYNDGPISFSPNYPPSELKFVKWPKVVTLNVYRRAVRD